MMPQVEHRAGLLIPSANTNIEPEYYAAMPKGVSLHFGRLALTEVTEAGIESQDRDVVPQARGLGTAKVAAILFAQTSASYFKGHEYNTDLKRRIEEASGVPAMTAAQTVDDALRTLGVRRISLATPFQATANERSARYLTASGFEVVGSEGLGIVDNFSIARIGRDRILELGRRADRPDADAIVMPGGNMPCLWAVEELERVLGKPVVTTNQAGIWALLRHLGGFERLPGFGRLLRDHLVA